MGIPLGRKIDDDTDRGREGDLFVPNGKYYCKVGLAEEREKKGDDGVTYIHAEYEIVDAEVADNEGAIGLRIFDLFSLTEDAVWKVAQFLDACYMTKFEGSEMPDDIVGQELVVRVANEKFGGRENLRVKKCLERKDWQGATMRTDSEGDQIVESSGNGTKSSGKGKGKGKDADVSV